LVTITGTNFDTASNVQTGANEVRVKFGARLSSDVRVTSATTIQAIVPRGDIADAVDSVDVDVEVENVVAGPNQGTGTLTDGYTYRRPNLVSETHLTGTVRTLLRRAKQQIIKNVALTTHTDYDLATADMLNRPELAKLPAVVLIGPSLFPQPIQNFTPPQVEYQGDPPVSFTKEHGPMPVDLEFDVRLMSASKLEMINLVHHATMFVHRSGLLDGVLCNPLSPGDGTVDYPLVLVDEFRATDSPSRANVRESVGRWRIEGVLLSTDDLLESAPVIDVTELQTEAIQ
jgi:hypothetical protein